VRTAADGEPDIELAAKASARELRFHKPPRVTLQADEITAVRAGLPRPVRAGVTYRRVAASARLASRLRVAIGVPDRVDAPACRTAADAP
jgi:hypothetical protein